MNEAELNKKRKKNTQNAIMRIFLKNKILQDIM